MAAWMTDELDRIGSAEEIQIAGQQVDGSLRRFTTIWVVRVGDGLYVRSVRGKAGRWYRGAVLKHVGRVLAGGLDVAVTFEDVTDAALHDQIDAAYWAKYGRWPQYVRPVVTPEARAVTLKMVKQ